ncbi:hypothetical protein FE263_20340 [Lichenicoccus roseus]|uniref:Transposase n=1 Tax=Lichenicoccus roseus TaxID=2683649 RepID=A0A5R9J531_9PROT|nr:hypothetical protein FE263_20340 [Lichenicoccus roseus]
MENRSGLVAQVCLTQASGTAERGAALVLVDRLAHRQQITLGADKGHDVLSFVFALRKCRITAHIATDRQISKLSVLRRSGVDHRTQRHPVVLTAGTQRTEPAAETPRRSAA